MAKLAIGECVTFVDRTSQPHAALVTAVWGENDTPSINVVIVDTTEGSRDNYGQQLIRETSVPHETSQNAPGYFWNRTTYMQ